jgi:hypothetical protein
MWPASDRTLSIWEHFTPRTNTIWIVYLIDMLRLNKFKGVCKTSVEKNAMTRFRCASELL